MRYSKMTKQFFIWVWLMVLLSCMSQKKLKSGQEAYEVKQYALAISFYKNEFEDATNKKSKASIAFQLGQCFSKISDSENELIWYKRAYDLGYGLPALEKYAFALKQNEQYDYAADVFNDLAEEAQGGLVYRREISICKLAQSWKDNKANPFIYIVRPFESLNETANDFAAIYSPTGDIYFSSDRFGTKGKKKYNWSGQFFSDLFILNRESQSADLISINNINTPDNEGSCSFVNHGEKLYFTRCSDQGTGNYYCQIYSTLLTQNEEPQLLDLGNFKCNNVNPAIYISDSILIFSSDREGGEGKYDLYLVQWMDEQWSKPINLGSLINTQGNEKFPTWDHDTLYFSSDYLAGMGGLDIFKTWRTKDGKWSSPQHLDYPMNSGADDFNFSKDPLFKSNDTIVQSGIFTSNRNLTQGDDIYSFQYIKNPNNVFNVPNKKVGKINIVATINFLKIETYKTENLNKELDSVQLEMTKDMKDFVYSGNKTKMTFYLTPNTEYHIKCSRRGYLNQILSFRTPALDSLERDTTINLDYKVVLVPLIIDREFVLDNVYYDYDKWDIREDAKFALDHLYEILISNPKINIVVVSHTDCRGEDHYNLNLSQKRAQSAVSYLINKGIPSNRLQSNGVGELDPAISCNCSTCTEEEHQKNRRTTFRIKL